MSLVAKLLIHDTCSVESSCRKTICLPLSGHVYQAEGSKAAGLSCGMCQSGILHGSRDSSKDLNQNRGASFSFRESGANKQADNVGQWNKGLNSRRGQ